MHVGIRSKEPTLRLGIPCNFKKAVIHIKSEVLVLTPVKSTQFETEKPLIPIRIRKPSSQW